MCVNGQLNVLLRSITYTVVWLKLQSEQSYSGSSSMAVQSHGALTIDNENGSTTRAIANRHEFIMTAGLLSL